MTETVKIVDYGSGNLRSVEKAFQRAARVGGVNANVAITADPKEVAAADRVVLPGVGAFGAGMDGLEAIEGMVAALEHAVLVEKRPFLGICVGLQLLAEEGREFGVRAGLGWIGGRVRPLRAAAAGLPTPHTGWNDVRRRAEHPALESLASGPVDFYFTHSYCFEAANDAHVLALADYGEPVAAVVGRDNILACQFHPEKSQWAGLGLIGDFLRWRP